MRAASIRLNWGMGIRTSHAAAAHAAKVHALPATATAGAAGPAAKGVRLPEEGIEDVPGVALCHGQAWYELGNRATPSTLLMASLACGLQVNRGAVTSVCHL